MQQHLLEAKQAEAKAAIEAINNQQPAGEIIGEGSLEVPKNAIPDKVPPPKESEQVTKPPAATQEDEALAEFAEGKHRKIRNSPAVSEVPKTTEPPEEVEVEPKAPIPHRKHPAVTQEVVTQRPQEPAVPVRKEPQQTPPMHPEDVTTPKKPIQEQEKPKSPPADVPKVEPTQDQTQKVPVHQEEVTPVLHETPPPPKKEPQQTKPLHQDEVEAAPAPKASPAIPSPPEKPKEEDTTNKFHLAFEPVKPPANFREQEGLEKPAEESPVPEKIKDETATEKH